MKNFWTEATVNRNADRAGCANPHEYLGMKQREFESDTGVRWSVSNVHGGYMFDPVDEGISVPASVDEGTVAAIRRTYVMVGKSLGYATYLDAHEASGISLGNLMGAVRWMERRGMALRAVNRMGKGYAFKLRN